MFAANVWELIDYHFTNLVLILTWFNFCQSIDIQTKEFKNLVGYQNTGRVSVKKVFTKKSYF